MAAGAASTRRARGRAVRRRCRRRTLPAVRAMLTAALGASRARGDSRAAASCTADARCWSEARAGAAAGRRRSPRRWTTCARSRQAAAPVCRLSFDLAELRGYQLPQRRGVRRLLPAASPARSRCGGRYDEVGKVLRARRGPPPASAWTCATSPRSRAGRRGAGAILAPCGGDAALRRGSRALRAAGEIVVVELPGHDGTRAELGCDRHAGSAGRPLDRSSRCKAT
ncbi:MAG: ATP phosphoribosyltransferase regulatory subunit [Chromatiales bacterium]|nr:ATP phosphoribosyltransferase regulatory subunit [Chromatiales bacterium]